MRERRDEFVMSFGGRLGLGFDVDVDTKIGIGIGNCRKEEA
jgi:hypothetical protein